MRKKILSLSLLGLLPFFFNQASYAEVTFNDCNAIKPALSHKPGEDWEVRLPGWTIAPSSNTATNKQSVLEQLPANCNVTLIIPSDICEYTCQHGKLVLDAVEDGDKQCEILRFFKTAAQIGLGIFMTFFRCF